MCVHILKSSKLIERDSGAWRVISSPNTDICFLKERESDRIKFVLKIAAVGSYDLAAASASVIFFLKNSSDLVLSSFSIFWLAEVNLFSIELTSNSSALPSSVIFLLCN